MKSNTIKERQDLCKDIEIACRIDGTVLETLIDEYVYKCTDEELVEWYGIVDTVLGE